MIDNAAYVRGLIQQWADGTLSEEGQAELQLARHLYSEEEWLRMEADAFCELGDARQGDRQRDWRAAFERVRRGERKARGRALAGKAASVLGAAALLLLVIWWGGRMLPSRPQPTDLGNNCPVWASDEEIPGSEFAATIWWGDSISITVDRSSRGRLGVIRNLEIWRDADGSLALLPRGDPMPADTAGIPAIRVATHPYQQCLVRLPDGSEIRLNASSVLEYPLWNLDRDTTFLRVGGQALVHLEEKEKSRETKVKLIVGTPNAQLQMAAGTYTVLAERSETRAALLDGKAVMFGRGSDEQQEMVIPGDDVTMKTVRTKDGAIKTETAISCINEKEALGWTRMKRTYRNTSVREFVADMSRWYGFKVENMNCVPEGLRITATVCYRAPVTEVYAQLSAADVFMVEKDGMISFCGPQIDPRQPSVPVPMPVERGLLALHR